MKKILVLSHTQIHSDFKIGSHHYANGLTDLGYEVHFSGLPITIFHKILKKVSRKGTRKVNNQVVDSQIAAIFPLTVAKTPIMSFINACFFKFNKNNRKLTNNFFDVVICDYPFFETILCKLNYGKLIYRPTDDYIAMMGEKTYFYERNICEASDFIVPTSSVVSDKIKSRYSVNSNKIKVITNGYDERNFGIISRACSHRENAIYIGALDERFDFEALKFLAQQRGNIKFNIFGPKSDYYAKFEKLFDNLDNVIFHGKVEYEDTNKLMNQHKVGLLLLTNITSNKGRSPMKLWEYIASGLNVVFSSIEGIKDYPGVYKYFDYDNMLNLFDDAYARENIDSGDSLKEHSWGGKVKEMEEISFNQQISI